MTPGGLPHSGIRGSPCAHHSPRLIAATPRPSSAHSAKASTTCSSSLALLTPQTSKIEITSLSLFTCSRAPQCPQKAPAPTTTRAFSGPPSAPSCSSVQWPGPTPSVFPSPRPAVPSRSPRSVSPLPVGGDGRARTAKPPACKAGALPVELHPRRLSKVERRLSKVERRGSKVEHRRSKRDHRRPPPFRPSPFVRWAFLGSNQRPQSYQDCALTC